MPCGPGHFFVVLGPCGLACVYAPGTVTQAQDLGKSHSESRYVMPSVILPDVPSVIRMAFEHHLGDAKMTNVLHFLYGGGPLTQTDLDFLANFAASEWTTDILAGMSNAVIFDQLVAQDLTSRTSPVSVITSGAHSSLTGAGAPLNSALVISHHIARRYRGGHPRTYIGGLRQVDVNDPTHWTSAIVAGYQTAWNTFIGNVVGSTHGGHAILEYVNVSYFSAGALRVTPVVDDVLSSLVKSGLGTQRRRVRSSHP